MVRAVLSRTVFIVAASSAALAGASPAVAQQEATKVPVTHEQIISANPFGLMFEWWNVEFERKINAVSTWGVNASYLGPGETDYFSVGGLYRYYPQGAALNGVFLGGRAGIYRVSDHAASGESFGLGFEVGYAWLLGARRNVGLSLGIGVTRLFGNDIGDGSVAVPTVRLLNLGIAF
jgi:hypothetical protein